MDHVAALTEAPEVAEPVVGRIVIQMRGGQHDAGCPDPDHLLEVSPARVAAPLVAPGLPVRVIPAAVWG